MPQVQIFWSTSLNKIIIVRGGEYFCFNRASSLLGLTWATLPILAQGDYRKEYSEERTLEILTSSDIEKIYEI